MYKLDIFNILYRLTVPHGKIFLNIFFNYFFYFFALKKLLACLKNKLLISLISCPSLIFFAICIIFLIKFLVEPESEEVDEDELVERAKLSRVANKVLRFLGLVCVQEDDQSGIYLSFSFFFLFLCNFFL